MKTPTAFFLFLLASCAYAGPSTSANYTVVTDSTNAGGQRSSSAAYSADDSVGEGFDTGIGVATGQVVKPGFIGQLYEAQSLVIAAAPEAVLEKTTSQLTGLATLDDETLVMLRGGDVGWTVIDGAIVGISGSGLATAGEVFINAPATVRGAWGGVEGDLMLTVLNSNVTQPGTTTPGPVFTSLDFAANQIGLYQGLLTDGGGNVVGALTGFKLLSTRAFTGKVVFNGVTYSLKGSVLEDGSFIGQILRKGKTALDVTLQLGTTASGGLTIQGSVSGDSTTGEGFIAQAPYTRLNPAPSALVKSYTFLVPATVTGNEALPGGDGFGSAKVSSLGVITAVGRTGDGVAFTTRGYLTADGQWHLFQLLYKKKGQLAGVLSFRDVAGISDVDGPLRWVKNPNPVNKSYPGGFNLDPGLVGAIYTPPGKGQRALVELADQHYNARLTLAGSVLPDGGLAKTLSWLNTNVLTYYGPEKLSARTASTTGVLSGSYYDAVTKLKVAFAGAVLQKQGLASGNFLVNNKSGYIFIEPGTGFPYPGSEGAGALVRLSVPGSLATPPILSPAAFSEEVAGSFGGLLNQGPAISGGLESVVISKTGGITGKVVIEGIRYTFRGGMDAGGLAHVEILRPGLSSIVGDLQLGLANGTVDGFQLTGAFTVDASAYEIDAQRFPVFTKTLPAPQTGKYTVAMVAPDSTDVTVEPGGDGYASLKVAYTGTTTGALTLADGTVTTFAGRVSRSGEWSLHRSLYGTTGGYLAGKLTFRDVAGISDVDGEWRWVKPNAVPRTPTYAGGFDVTRGVIGSLFVAPVAGQSAFGGLANTGYNTWLRLSGPDMSTLPGLSVTAVDRAATWSPLDKILYYGPDKATVTFSRTTGLVSGRYIDTANKVSIKFGGALLQKQGLVTGRYTSNEQSGLFTMSPR
jgi:hypothetical protein